MFVALAVQQPVAAKVAQQKQNINQIQIIKPAAYHLRVLWYVAYRLWLYGTLKSMKLLIFYRQDAEYTRQVEEYIHDLMVSHNVKDQDIVRIDPDTAIGTSRASAYGIMAYPGLVVSDENGQYIHGWSGDLPLADELMGYLFSLQ